MTQDRLPGLDVLRGIAALFVVHHHAYWSPAQHSYLAVDMFWMLSGYVMARTYEERMHSGMTARSFLRMRWWRLWPIMAVGGLLGAVVLSANVGPGVVLAWVFALNILLIPTPMGDRLYSLNGPSWSVAMELIANALHALVLVHLRMRVLVAIVVATLIVVTAHMQDADQMPGPLPGSIIAGLCRMFMAYTMGIILFRWWRDRPVIPVGAAFTVMAMPVYFMASTAWGDHRTLIDIPFVLLVCPLVIAGGIQMQRAWPIGAWFGAISFPLYAIHVPVIQIVTLRLSLEAYWAVPASIVLAWIVTRAERRVREWAKSFGPTSSGATGDPYRLSLRNVPENG